MGGPRFNWHEPFGDQLWVAQLRLSNVTTGPLADPSLRLEVKGPFTMAHHFGIEIWDQQRDIPTISPIDVFTTMQSVTSLMAFHVRNGEVRYRR